MNKIKEQLSRNVEKEFKTKSLLIEVDEKYPMNIIIEELRELGDNDPELIIQQVSRAIFGRPEIIMWVRMTDDAEKRIAELIESNVRGAILSKKSSFL